MNDPRIDEIIAFWFGDGPVPPPDKIRRWFVRDAAFDAEIRARFGALHDEASAGGLAAWRDTAQGQLALLVVLDQFSRNMFRDDPRAFAQDRRALPIALELLDSGRVHELGYVQRMVATLPLQHAEDRAIQIRSVKAYATLLAEARAAQVDPETLAILENALDYAEQHAAIIERFGRFPHRNKALGRPSSDDEIAFLQTPGSSF